MAPTQVSRTLEEADSIGEARVASCREGDARSHSSKSSANPLWGSPRILGEPSKIGVVVSTSTVEKCMIGLRKPPSPTWRAFLKNHATEIVAIDFFVVPSVRNRILFVLLIPAYERRRVVHCSVTSNPTSKWTAQQIVGAFPWETPSTYLFRNNDKIHGGVFQQRVRNMGFDEVRTAPQSSLQNPYAARLIGRFAENDWTTSS